MRASEERQRDIGALGVKSVSIVSLPGTDNALLSFEVDEDERSWPTLATQLSPWAAVDVVRTEFTTEEIQEASWVALVPAWHLGYPQAAERDGDYRETTYDLSEFCTECGLGLRQNAPFRLSAEPRWGRRSIMQLNWIFDEYFVKADIVPEFLDALDIPHMEVLDVRSKRLQTVRQMLVTDCVSVETIGLPFVTCVTCGRVKYRPLTRGRFPRLAGAIAAHAVKTNEYFGDGASAFREVLISADVVRVIGERKIRGVTFIPVEE